MAEDTYISDGLNPREMADKAAQCRKEFDIASPDKVDVISILELKLPELIPGFHVIVRRDADLESYAKVVPSPPRLLVRESVYRGAAEGDPTFRVMLAHEIGHIFLHFSREDRTFHSSPERYEENIENLNGLESAEAQADIFSFFFLLPYKSAIKHRANPLALCDKYGVTLEVARKVVMYSKRQEFYESARPRKFLEQNASATLRRSRTGHPPFSP